MATKKGWPDARQNIRFEQKTGYPRNLHAASSKISYAHKKFMMVEKKGAPYLKVDIFKNFGSPVKNILFCFPVTNILVSSANNIHGVSWRIRESSDVH